MKKPDSLHAGTRRPDFTRRDFVAGAGALAGLLAMPSTSAQTKLVAKTLFFNLAHENVAARPHYFVINGVWYPLTRTIFDPTILARERLTNRFLRGVPDDQITHHLEGVMVDPTIASLGYVPSNINSGTGTWSMSMMAQLLPGESFGMTYRRARASAPVGPLPLSAKRMQYGHPPAMTLQDLQEEQVLVDSNDHARTLIGLHPDLVCAEATSAAHIHTTYITTNSKTRFLGGILRSLGPADPQQNSGQPNAKGWATMLPINQDDNVTPFKTSTGLNQYMPDWHSQVDEQVAGGVNEIHRQVKNDPTIGADVTSPPGDTTGKVWYRRDGTGYVDRSVNNVADPPALKWDFQSKSSQMGLVVSQPTVTVNNDGSVTVTLNNVANWFLRYLGMYLQFIGPNNTAIPVASLPTNVYPARQSPTNPLDTTDLMFAGIVGPPFTLAGIPVDGGSFNVTLNLPQDLFTLSIFYGGYGLNGSFIGPKEDITDAGACMTIAINYGVVALFMAVGVSGISAVTKSIVGLVGQVIVQEVLVGITSGVSDVKANPSAAGLAFLKGILNGVVLGKGIAALATVILTQMAAAQIIDAVPVAGQIARAVAAVIGGIQLAETAIETGISPPVYQFDLVLTHDVSVTIYPDVNNNQFPEVPSGYTLYYKITYLFDNGTAHVKDAVDVPDPTVKSIATALTGLPRGGQLKVSVGFYARQTSTPAGMNDWNAGNGTTGLTDNTKDDPLSITITQTKIPITPTTTYIHTRKTALNSSGGHLWVNTPQAPPYTAPSGGQSPGDLGAFRSITVRQGTANQQGYLGYSWQAYSSGLLDCTANAPGQLDQAANLNTDAGNNGANAQNGYANPTCGLQGGATSGMKLSYSLLNDDAMNFYLDTSSLHIRQVALNPPSFANPTQGQSFGQLNLDSARVLLHPAGHIVSINNENHKLEMLKLPGAAMDDADATANYLARTAAGQGSRPGLITSPVSAAISPEGVILVLEDAAANNRIQAFDLGGNPVPFFKGQATPYFLTLPATAGATYLDVAIEFSGYIYVLSQTNNVFRLDIYHPAQTDQNPICTTQGVNAARLCVDFWRSVYTLNYEVLQLPGGGFPRLTEPSVSLWVPSIPS